MIKAFIEISTGGKQGVRDMGLAEGVSEALIATATGLAISILAFVFYSLFRSRVQKYICELEAAATHLVALLHAEFVRETPQSFSSSTPWTREDFSTPIVSPLAGDRPDVRGL
jgi:biopolymer transport protein ExbB